MTGHAGRGTARQALLGLTGALLVGAAAWAGLVWLVLHAVERFWP